MQWWIMDTVPGPQQRERMSWRRAMKRGLQLLIRDPFFPKTPVPIVRTSPLQHVCLLTPSSQLFTLFFTISRARGALSTGILKEGCSVR